MDPDPTLNEILCELAALKERVAALEAPRGITCSALTVVNSENETMAEIDPSGLMQCRRLRVQSPGEDTWLSFEPFSGELTIFVHNHDDGSQVKVAVVNESKLGELTLHAPPHFKTRSYVRLTPTQWGGRMELGDKNGKAICDVNANTMGATWILNSSDPFQGGIRLGVDGSSNGEIVVFDVNGDVSVRLP